MFDIINRCTDPYWNLALEEYFLKNSPVTGDLLILWRNCPTVVIGRNQNTATEINHPYIAANHINVVRRLSGGGAVYHDLGNLNFTFITNTTGKRHNFAHFTLPIIKALATCGITAEFTGRNDLTIAGQKFSGNAQYIYHNRLLHHGTLLFDTNLAVLQQALAGPGAKHAGSGVQSVPSRVTTIFRHLPKPINSVEFEDILRKIIFANAGIPYNSYELSAADNAAIEDLIKSRYQTSNWNYGTLPPCTITRKQKFAGGTVQVLLTVKAGIIQQAALYGDFFASGDVNELATLLAGIPFTRDAVTPILSTWLKEHPIHNILPDDLLSCFFSE